MSHSRSIFLTKAVVKSVAAVGLALTALLGVGASGASATTLTSASTSPLSLAPAEGPVSIPPGTQIVDNAGLLGSKKADVQKAIDSLRKSRGATMYVVIVKSFDGQDPATWANTVMKNKQGGRNDFIFAIATDDRKFGRDFPTNSKLKSDQQSNITAVFTSEMSGKDISASIVSAALVDTAKAAEDAYGGGSGKPSSPVGAIVGVGVVIVALAVGAGLFIFFRRKRAQRTELERTQGFSSDGRQLDSNAGTPLEELRARAGSALIAMDDAVKSNEQEIAFAQASYGDEAVKPFQQALETAKGHLRESFNLQQKLDDDIPDTVEEQRAWYGEIISRAEASKRVLDEQKAQFDQLRDLEHNVSAISAQIGQEEAKARRDLAGASATLHELQGRYAASATSTLKDNPAQATERLDFVNHALERANERVQAGDNSEAAVAVRAAEQALRQAQVLIDALAKGSETLHQAEDSLPQNLAEAQNDLVQARTLAASDPSGRAKAEVDAAESTLQRVDAAMRSGAYDPGALLAQVQTAHSNLDSVLTTTRDRRVQEDRARSALQQAIGSAQSTIAGVQDYIAARRGGVGAQARTRISEAQRNLDTALSLTNSDPVSALNYANQALALAQQAGDLAQQDVDNFGNQYGNGQGYYNNYGNYGGGGYNRGGGFGAGFGGAILGGILGGMLSGGNHNSGWGGGGGDWGGFDDGGGSGDFGGGDWGGGGGDSGNF